jgi:ubiquinone/menaquinone biosynthesis C-methylase UbiE
LKGWGRFQTAEEMEVNRKYEYERTFLPRLYRWLNLKPHMTVMDLGCGSGYFTRILASGLKGKGKVLGIDPDASLVSNARKITAEKRLATFVQFKVGSIYEIPVSDNYADLVACHILLCNIPRQFDAILEMKRIAKTGGKIVAIEPAYGGGTYFPDERLNELHEKFSKAFGTAINKEWREKLDMTKFTENIHLRLPELFLKAELKNVALRGYLSTFLLCDKRRSIREMQKHLEARLGLWQKLKKRNLQCALIGGMPKEEFEELYYRYSDYLKSLVENPGKITETPEVEILSRVIVTGEK